MYPGYKGASAAVGVEVAVESESSLPTPLMEEGNRSKGSADDVTIAPRRSHLFMAQYAISATVRDGL